MPINTHQIPYLNLQIIHEHYILKVFAQNLQTAVDQYRHDKINDLNTVVKSFDDAHQVLMANQQYLRYCATTLAPQIRKSFLNTTQILQTNQEISIINIMDQWLKFDRFNQTSLVQYHKWIKLIHQNQPALNSFNQNYFTLALRCQAAYQKYNQISHK